MLAHLDIGKMFVQHIRPCWISAERSVSDATATGSIELYYVEARFLLLLLLLLELSKGGRRRRRGLGTKIVF